VDPELFVRRNTAITAPPVVPEIRLHLATEVTPIWQATEETLAQGAIPPPFWAFAWAGGQALARYLLDHPAEVAGRSVLDFGAGSGLVAIAAAKAGAASVLAAEIDHFAAAAIAANAAINSVAIEVTSADVIGTIDPRWEVVTAGDVCYEQPMADRVAAWLRDLAGQQRLVLLGDPGRTYLPAAGLCERARYLVPTSRDLEDRELRVGVVWRVLPLEPRSPSVAAAPI
jgi:predicted nicotinamide N-methyase